jgi:hypothetical protein
LKFSRGYLYGYDRERIMRRLEIVHGPLSVYSDLEMAIARNVEGAVKRASDVRKELGFDKSLITWICRKLGRESEYRVRSVGRGVSYHVELTRGRPG